jgi:hypothetical protein
MVSEAKFFLFSFPFNWRNLLFNLYHITESDGVKEEERRNRISKMIQIEDLQAQDGHPVAPLCIKDQLCHKKLNDQQLL